MNIKQEIFNKIKGGLIVSCQALPDEPLHSSYIMSRMALASKVGGAIGIRANTPNDIREIQKTVDLPIIGIIKKVYEDSDVYITPTMKEVDDLAACNVPIIAMDATNRLRTGGRSLDKIFKEAKLKYPNIIFMADCSCYEEALHAVEIGFDCVGTTLSGYTPYTQGTSLPDISFISKITKEVSVPVIAEGGIHYPDELRQVLDAGAWCAVIGGAITRPLEITKRFTKVLA